MNLAQEILAGNRKITKGEVLNILHSEEDWWSIFAAAMYLKNQVTQNSLRLNVLLSAKQGICNEDCGYCAQSRRSTEDIEKYGLVPNAVILRKAVLAKKNHASVFCIALSGTKPSKKEVDQLCEIIPTIKKRLGLEICLSAGFVDNDQLEKLKRAGINRINHNLNTPRENYRKIATTHNYDDRCETLKRVNAHQIDVCSGFICGMGETDSELVELAFDLKDRKPFSIPVNFLLAIEGTPLAGKNELTPLKCLKIMTMMRFIFPRKELRLSAGREKHFGDLQPMALLLVNSTFLGDYLTEEGENKNVDLDLLENLALKIENS
ncbi:biotin synthase BioB [Liquorilactobacillus capillatus]|uniref:Biotin synthase n=1 Tax=Liquorilactobacillus capillatus DSM 19910 TaxID=1423731 RepID=A0A0R1MAB6_9LACO|nr:biotin synthase BioB [Liquorilactobacillus capillatus]KRL01147.1 biotin synthetase [Liquorilactobacillus capillatus DSM 19910]